MFATDLALATPLLILAGAALFLLVLGAFLPRPERVVGLGAMAALAASAVAAVVGPQGQAFSGALTADAASVFAQVVICLGSLVSIPLGQAWFARRGIRHFEFPVLVLLAALGMAMMAGAGDLLSLYIGVELQSLALYVMAALQRDDAKASEAGLKYFVLGALSSGLLLYGASLVYGFSGAIRFDAIAAAVQGEAGTGVLFGLVFMICGLAFKVSAAPFHMWTPDVYEGAPTPVTAFLATAPKVAAMALFGRVVHDAFGAIPGDWGQVVAALAVVSMFLGAVAAIGQRDIKRLMAYSSISHMGFALLGLAAGTAGGVQAMLIYMAIYVTMNIGTFAFILSMEKDGRPVTSIDSLNMYSRREPLRALAMLVLMFSLAGVPPTVGFFGKLYVLKAAVEGGMAWLAVLGVVASVIGAFYYLRIVFYMYFGKDGDRLDGPMPAVQWVLLVGSAAVMLIGIVNLFGIEATAAVAAQTLVR